MGIAIIIGFYCLGEFTHKLFSLPVPGAVIGLVYLYIYLIMHKGVSSSLQSGGRLLISNLPLLLIPSSAGVVLCMGLLQEKGLVIALILSISIVFSLMITAWMMSRLQRHFYDEP